MKVHTCTINKLERNSHYGTLNIQITASQIRGTSKYLQVVALTRQFGPANPDRHLQRMNEQTPLPHDLLSVQEPLSFRIINKY